MTPTAMIAVPALVSFVAWLIPGGSPAMRGFEARVTPSWQGLLVLVLWYGCVIGSAALGARMGRRIAPLVRANGSKAHIPGRDRDAAYLIFTIMALIGVVYSLELVRRGVGFGPLRQHQANLLYESLPSGFGVHTLRYASALSSAMALERLASRRRFELLLPVNLALLAATALLSSRLSVALAATLFLYMRVRAQPGARIRFPLLAAALAVGFVVLMPFSYSRNAGYYAVRGIDGPVQVNAAQIWSYLGTPTQVAVGVAGAAAKDGFGGSGSMTSGLEAIRPTYLQAEKSDKNADTDAALYGYSTNLLPTFSTNSVFADTLARFGFLGLLATLAMYAVWGLLFGHFRQYESSLSLIAGVTLYGFFETWRVFLLNAGVLHFLVLSVAAVGAIVIPHAQSTASSASGPLGRPTGGQSRGTGRFPTGAPRRR